MTNIPIKEDREARNSLLEFMQSYEVSIILSKQAKTYP